MPVTVTVWYYLQKCLLSVPCANMGVNANPYVPGWHLWVYTPRVGCIPLPSADRMHQSTSVEVLITNKVTQELSTDRQENGWVHVTHTCAQSLNQRAGKMNYGSKTVDLRKIRLRIQYKGWNHFYNETEFLSSNSINLFLSWTGKEQKQKRTKAGKALTLGEASEQARGMRMVMGTGLALLYFIT